METLAAREAGQPDPHTADESAGYGQGRSVPPLREGVLVDEQSQRGYPVGRIPRQPTIRRENGVECRLDELLGRGFAVIGRKQSDLHMGAQARAVLQRLAGRSVSLEGTKVIRGEMEDLFDAHPAAVLRPDRYVFGVVDEECDLDRLLLELGRKLALR